MKGGSDCTLKTCKQQGRGNAESTRKFKIGAYNNIISVKEIPAKQSDIFPKSLKRVAAYARVSTLYEEQSGSFDAQIDALRRKIDNNPDWLFIGVFSDRGITGTNTKNRDGFNEMIELALNGGIDLILTKSISRFARNTVDTLQTVRDLKAVNVEVIFEKENLHTFDPRCEVFLTIMSSLAQEESRNLSENIKWGIVRKMEKGNFSLPYKHFLGYKKGASGEPEIIKREARTVREIYYLFLNGRNITQIAKYLTRLKRKNPSGNTKWCYITVFRILVNEKYAGVALLQKTYTPDYLNHKSVKNERNIRKYFVQNSHPAVVSLDVFIKTQEKLVKNGYTGANIEVLEYLH